jgi:phage N-6-adenine-methyltransferase
MAGAIMNVTSDKWGTPFEFFLELERLFGKFDLDAAADDGWAMCDKYITLEQDALNPETPWDGQNIYLNPPYGHWIPLFLDRVLKEAEKGKRIVCLLPAKVDTKWFHDVALTKADEIIFVRGRLKFRLEGKNNTATFPSIVVCFNTAKDFPKQHKPCIWSMRNK